MYPRIYLVPLVRHEITFKNILGLSRYREYGGNGVIFPFYLNPPPRPISLQTTITAKPSPPSPSPPPLEVLTVCRGKDKAQKSTKFVNVM